MNQLSYRDPDETSETLVNTNHPFPVAITGGDGYDSAGKVVRVEEQFSYTHSAGSATVVIKNAAGFLHCVTVNTTAASIITLFDNPSTGAGTTIAILKASIAENSYFYDIKFTNGLTIVLAGASDITVSWR